MKRFTYWPQIGLGLAFSWGALMGWAAAFGRLDLPAYLLYSGAICWVIGYDTIYAHQDREDDALIGVKSTALLFGARTKPMLARVLCGGDLLIALAGGAAGGGCIFGLGLLAFASHLAWQIVRLDIDDPANCLVVFKSNRDAGLILFAATGAGGDRAFPRVSTASTSRNRIRRLVASERKSATAGSDRGDARCETAAASAVGCATR